MSEQTNDSKQNLESEPLPWEHGIGAKLVLDEMGIKEDENLVMVSCKVERFTVEAKVQPKDYEQARGYAEFVPQDLWVHVPVYDPGKLVDDATGNLGIFGTVFKTIARELDLAVFTVASERVDRKVAAQDNQAAAKSRRFDAGKGVVAAKKKAGEVL